MVSIFISYRRDDSSGYAGRLYDKLSNHFGQGQVFMDINTMESGVDFVEVIENAVSSSDVLIAVISKQWLTITDNNGNKRLDNPTDFVRLEIAAALDRNIRVIPVLVQGASMPRTQDLPDVLVKLARRNAFEISDTRWEYDTGILIEKLQKIVNIPASVTQQMIFKPTSTISTEQQNPDESFVYSLASSKARSLMKIVDVESFAVDDCIILTNSKNFEGWDRNEVTTTILYTHLPIPEDLEKLREEKLPDFEKKYYDSPHYRLVSFRPSFRTWSRLDVTLAPIGFLEYYSLTPFFDAPLLAAPDGSKVSIRQKYGSTALTYSSITQGTSLIPTPVSIQCIAITKDQQILLMRRSSTVAFYPDHWSASFEETMNASGLDPNGKIIPADADFFEGAIRGLDEEFAIPSSAVESIKLLSLNVEYPTLSVDAITVIKIDLTASEIKNSWLLYAMDKDEASKFDLLSTELTAVIDKLFSKILWHPSARMRLIQFLFHTYGIEEVVKTIQSKMNSDKTD